MSDKENNELHPKFYRIPHKIAIDKELRPVDSYIYGTLYWFGQLRNRVCTASNKAIATATKNIAERTVERSLVRLERRGYIKRIFFDEKRRHRKEIKCLLKIPKNNPEVDINSLMRKSKTKPYFNGQEMRKKSGKWWVIPEGDGHPWLEYAGKESEIEWK